MLADDLKLAHSLPGQSGLAVTYDVDGYLYRGRLFPGIPGRPRPCVTLERLEA